MQKTGVSNDFVSAVKQTCRNNLIDYACVVKKDYQVNWHHRIIADALTRVADGDCKRLIISVPPRHGKSELASVLCPSWFLGRNPKGQVMITSYSASLADSFSRRARNLTQETNFKAVFPNFQLSDDSQSVKAWHTTSGGHCISAGVGGAITGKGFHLGIIDDPISNREEAESQLIRDKIWDWYTSTFYTRQEKDAAIVLMMTRWHEDDLAGRLIEAEKAGGEQWEKVTLSAINEDPSNEREIGDPLWPDKYSIEDLQKIKKNIGDRDWNALYQQKPFNEAGGMFKKAYFQHYAEPLTDSITKKITFVDPAISEKQTADYTAIVTIGLNEKNQIFVLDVVQERMNPDDLINTLFSVVNTYEPDIVGIENVQFQKMLILEIRKQMNMRNVFFHLEEVRPTGEKTARIASTLQARYSNASVFHLKHKCSELESELIKFPTGKHDDIIDALAGAVSLADVQTKQYDSRAYMDAFM